jgi:hypothetical protein
MGDGFKSSWLSGSASPGAIKKRLNGIAFEVMQIVWPPLRPGAFQLTIAISE